VFISVLVGAKTAGLVGVVVAVPMAVVAKTSLMNLRSLMAQQEPETTVELVPAVSSEMERSKIPS
jgi:predicted PurR-regulated permease PerM